MHVDLCTIEDNISILRGDRSYIGLSWTSVATAGCWLLLVGCAAAAGHARCSGMSQTSGSSCESTCESTWEVLATVSVAFSSSRMLLGRPGSAAGCWLPLGRAPQLLGMLVGGVWDVPDTCLLAAARVTGRCGEVLRSAGHSFLACRRVGVLVLGLAGWLPAGGIGADVLIISCEGWWARP